MANYKKKTCIQYVADIGTLCMYSRKEDVDLAYENFVLFLGWRFVHGHNFIFGGNTVFDCHAEVLARRSFIA